MLEPRPNIHFHVFEEPARHAGICVSRVNGTKASKRVQEGRCACETGGG